MTEPQLRPYLATQWRALLTLAYKETARIVRIWKMTIMPPLINTYLFCLVFGQILGTKVGVIAGLEYIRFIVPGLIMNIVVIESFNNVASSIMIDKYHRAIDDLTVSPMHPLIVLLGYLCGGLFRALIAGSVTSLMAFYLADISIQHPLLFGYTFITTSLAFSSFGVLIGLYATRFDQIPTIPTFVLTPLAFFAGTFYDIRRLPSPWQEISWLNPIAYMVDTFRYSICGVTFHDIYLGLSVIGLLAILLLMVAYSLLRSGYGLRS